MKLSGNALQLCNMKFGKGVFYGFEKINVFEAGILSEKEAREVFDELLENGLIDLSTEDVHISALGQHICNMLCEPEQYIYLENKNNRKSVKIYIRNTYYLSIIEDLDSGEKRKYQMELLPRLELVTSAFVYALYQKENTKDKADIKVMGWAWNRNRKCVSEILIVEQIISDEIPERINRLTNWMIQNLANRYAEGEVPK